MRFAASPSIAYQQQRTSPTATGHLAADVIVAFDQWKDVKCFVSLINFMSTFSASIFLSSHITHAVHNNQMTYCLSLSLFHCTRVLRGGDLKRFWIPSCQAEEDPSFSHHRAELLLLDAASVRFTLATLPLSCLLEETEREREESKKKNNNK